jgi:predicted small lipoprotein YifL
MRNLALLPIALAMAISLAGCGGEPEAGPSDEPTETSTPTSEPTEAPVTLTFAMPDDCLGILPQSRQDALASQGLVLLGGPGGQYEQYYGDPTPEERAGGISCIWGDEDVPESLVTVSVAPLSASTRSIVVDDLISQGLNEAVLDDGISYAQLGDEVSAPAILNIVRDDSWVSIIQTLGGEAFFDEAVELASEVADQVYAP